MVNRPEPLILTNLLELVMLTDGRTKKGNSIGSFVERGCFYNENVIRIRPSTPEICSSSDFLHIWILSEENSLYSSIRILVIRVFDRKCSEGLVVEDWFSGWYNRKSVSSLMTTSFGRSVPEAAWSEIKAVPNNFILIRKKLYCSRRYLDTFFRVVHLLWAISSKICWRSLQNGSEHSSRTNSAKLLLSTWRWYSQRLQYWEIPT